MMRIDPYTYRVRKNEKITVEVSSQGFAPPLATGSGGRTTTLNEDQPANDTVTWSFRVTRDPGQKHRVRLGFDFPPGAGPSDHYHIHVSGNERDGFDAPDFYATDGPDMGLEFRVGVS